MEKINVFPIYLKSSCHFFRFDSPTELIVVMNEDWCRKIEYLCSDGYLDWLRNEESNELEFKKAYKKTQNELNKIVGL